MSTTATATTTTATKNIKKSTKRKKPGNNIIAKTTNIEESKIEIKSKTDHDMEIKANEYNKIIELHQSELVCNICFEVPSIPTPFGCSNNHTLCLTCWVTLKSQTIKLRQSDYHVHVEISQKNNKCVVCLEAVFTCEVVEPNRYFHHILEILSKNSPEYKLQHTEETKCACGKNHNKAKDFLSCDSFQLNCPFTNTENGTTTNCQVTGKFTRDKKFWNAHIKECKSIVNCVYCNNLIGVDKLDQHLKLHKQSLVLSNDILNVGQLINESTFVQSQLMKHNKSITSIWGIFKASLLSNLVQVTESTEIPGEETQASLEVKSQDDINTNSAIVTTLSAKSNKKIMKSQAEISKLIQYVSSLATDSISNLHESMDLSEIQDDLADQDFISETAIDNSVKQFMQDHKHFYYNCVVHASSKIPSCQVNGQELNCQDKDQDHENLCSNDLGTTPMEVIGTIPPRSSDGHDSDFLSFNVDDDDNSEHDDYESDEDYIDTEDNETEHEHNATSPMQVWNIEFVEPSRSAQHGTRSNRRRGPRYYEN